MFRSVAACGLIFLIAGAAQAQHAASSERGLESVPWFDWGSAVSSGAPIKRQQTATIDLRTGSDETITVYGRRKAPDFHTREQDRDDPRWLAPPPIGGQLYRGSTSCAGAAYDTIAGQPATGLDLIGSRC